MENIKHFLEQYIRKKYSEGDVVAAKNLKDELVPALMSDDRLVSKVLSDIRAGILAMVADRLLERLKPGVYIYRPNKYSDSTDSPAPYVKSPVMEKINPEAYFDARRIMLHFASVNALAQSEEFLVQHNLDKLDFNMLQGMSF